MICRVHAACLITVCLCCNLPFVHAQPTQRRQATLCSASGPDIPDWKVQDWMNKYFEDGSKGDKVVNSNILLVFTQCYGGDAMENFNSTTGETTGGPAVYDEVSFTNTTAMSGCQPGKLGVYGGFHVGASNALKPGNMSVDVFLGGLVTSDATEMPMQAGSNRRIGGETSTHVLVWGGKPNSYDWSDVQKVRNNFAGQPNTTVTVLAGDGMNPLADGPADEFNLELAMKVIGAKMDDGVDEQFIFYVADHGSHKMVTHSVTAPARSGGVASMAGLSRSGMDLPGIVNVPVPLDTAMLVAMLNDAGNQPNITLSSIMSLSAELRSQLMVTFGTTNRLIVPLSDPSVVASTLLLPDGTTTFTYSFPVNEACFDLSVGLPQSPQFLEIANYSILDLPLESVIVGIGDISKVPEPSGILLLLAVPLLLARHRRGGIKTSQPQQRLESR